MARRGRPPHPGPLTPAEERVLACVREGMPNAEIAVRLGVSVNTVRYHVSNLLAKAGAASREELGRWRPRDGGGGRSRAWLGLLMAKPVAVVLGVLAVASVGVFLFAPLPAAEETEPVELPEPFTRPDADELREQGFLDVGPLLEVEGGGDAALGHSVRDLFSVVLLSGPAQFVELAGSDVHVSLDLGVPRSPVSRRLTAANGGFIVWARSLSSDPREEPVLVGASERATLAVWAGDENGNVLHRATITPDGHAWVDTALLPRDAAYDQWSGQMLGIDDEMHAGMLPVGQASTDFHFTGCVSGPCYASYRVLSGPLLAPAAGVLVCEAAESLMLELTIGTLRFDWANTGSGVRPDFDCERHEVRAGEEIGPPSHYSITATDASGRPLSLGISPDGHLYAGDFAPTVGCPCRHGN